jgi:hypothetical protein
MKRQRPPLEILTTVAEFFLASAEELDARVEAAVTSGQGSQADVIALMTLADERRLRAASVAEKAAPFCSPRLAAVEVAAASTTTRDRLSDRYRQLSDEEAVRLLAAVEAGTLSIGEVADAIEH